MIKTIQDDIKGMFRDGNKLTIIILGNIFFFMFLLILKIMFREYFSSILANLSLSSDFTYLLMHPWVIITHMFVHIDLFHLIFNMFFYYWFGNIVGDLIGDKKIIPLYIIGGLGGFIAYSIYNLMVPNTSIAYGASAAVMATVGAAAFIAPNLSIRLILLGKVPIKYIALAYLVIDLAKISDQSNIGGHISHIGGMAIGVLFVYLLKNGTDLSLYINHWGDQILSAFRRNKQTKLKVSYRKSSNDKSRTISNPKYKTNNKVHQHDVDIILDKVKKKGYDSLTAEEKETLFIASKQNES